MTLSKSALDPKIPFLSDTLDRHQAQTQLQTIFPNLSEVAAATLIRHKPGRRALIEYQLDTTGGPLALLGKIRAKGTDWHSYKIQQSLWNSGFAADSPDGFSVPEPLGVIPGWQMWLQRKAPGVPATEVLPTPAGILLARRIAALAHKLHRAPIPTTKTHTLADELRILHERLPLVTDEHPQWRSRIARILHTCDRLAAPYLPITRSPHIYHPIHRDFYPDQILVDRDRLWLVDLDLCCQGDPALDIGNFIAHMTEQSLRQTGDPSAMSEPEATLKAAFIQVWLASEPDNDKSQLCRAIKLYTVLSLVRHIHISTRIVSRQFFTEKILTLCETWLQIDPQQDSFVKGEGGLFQHLFSQIR